MIDPIVNERIFSCRTCNAMKSVTITRQGRLTATTPANCQNRRECTQRMASKAGWGIVDWDRDQVQP